MLKTILYRLVVWLIVCALCTAAFGMLHQKPIELTELAKAVFYGLRLDITFFGYLVLMTIAFYWHPVSFKVSQWIFGLMLFFQISICVIDINLFSSWKHNINYQFFEYLKYPSTAIGNASGLQLLWGSVFMIMGLILSYYLAIKKHPIYQKPPLKKSATYGLSVLYIIAGVIMSRGGVQVAPANISFAFFGNQMPLNYAAVNNSWNFIFTLLNGQEDEDIQSFRYFKNAEAQFQTEFGDSSITPQIVKGEKPNIVIILMESFTANLVGACGAKEDYTPQFNALAKGNILFANAYASGNRTEKGLAAVISGFPAQATASIVTLPSKAQKLPSIFKVLKKQGYHSTFYYGGETEFANMKAYLLNSGVDKINSNFNYPTVAPRGKWGVHDEFMFAQLANEIKTSQEPFCKMLLTLSSHEPFDYPNSHAGENAAPINFRNSISYTDSCLGVFWQNVKNTTNTLFVFMADHGRIIEKSEADQIPMVNRMPILLAGEALKKNWKGKTWQHAINQHHFPSNLFQICGILDDDISFQFQGNWFNPKQWAYFTYYNGAGITNGNQWCKYDNELKNGFVHPHGQDSTQMIHLSQLYQQRVMEEFVKK